MLAVWTPGDPSRVGLAMTFAYLLAAWCCWRTSGAARAPDGASAHYRRIASSRYVVWLILAAVLALLAIERQLNLLALGTDILREKAMQHGWYHERRDIQEPVAIALSVGGAILVLPAMFVARRAGWWAMLGVAGMVALVVFAFVRAISWHVIDDQLWSWWLGIRLNYVIEGGLILFIALMARAGLAGTRSDMRLARLRAVAFAQRRRRERADAAATAGEGIEPRS